MFTYMTHAAQASRGKGIQLEHRGLEESSKRCKSKWCVCTANWSLKSVSPPGNSLCRGWGCAGEFRRVVKEQSCALSAPSMWRWFEVLWGSREEAPSISTAHRRWWCSVERGWAGVALQGAAREAWWPFSEAHEPPSHGQQTKVWCWTPSAPCLLPLLQLWESFLRCWEEMDSLEAARAS